MSKSFTFAIAAALLTTTTALTPVEALARGGGGGHGFGGFGGGGGGGGGGFRAFTPKLQTFKMQTFKAAPRITHVAPKITHVTPKFVKPTVHATRKLDTHRETFRKFVKHDIAPKIVKPTLLSRHFTPQSKAGKVQTVLQTAQLAHTLHAAKPQAMKLTADHFKVAKIMDGKGNHFSATKKMWFDGKHWWKGRWAWLFINGAWYYGNSPWTQTESGWTSTDTVYRPECVDCGGAPKTVTAAMVPPPPAGPAGAKKVVTAVKPPCVQPKPVGAGPADAGAQTQTDEPMATAGSDQAQQEPTVTGIPGSAPQGCKPGNGTEMGTDGATAKIDPATSEATVQPITTTPGEATVSPAAVGPSSPSPTATECRQFVPAIGMTIEVPCGS